MKDKIWTAPDFDDPLPKMEEYTYTDAELAQQGKVTKRSKWIYSWTRLRDFWSSAGSAGQGGEIGLGDKRCKYPKLWRAYVVVKKSAGKSRS